MTRLRADALLLFTAVIWGTAFVAQKAGNESMGPLAFVGVRFLLSTIALAPLAYFENQRGRSTAPVSRGDYGLLAVIGLLLAVGGMMQQTAMITVSATTAGFLTALYVVIVPFATWVLTREVVRPIVMLACIVAVIGAWILTATSGGFTWGSGESLLLASVVMWAFWIAMVAIFLKRANRPFLMAFVQFGITAVIALAAVPLFEPRGFAGVTEALPALLYTGLLSGAVAFTLQGIAQRYTPPAEAALIMSLESVFAAIAGAVLLNERLESIAVVGCALILAGVIAAEIGPTLLKRRSL